jgi:hypothetical protein
VSMDHLVTRSWSRRECRWPRARETPSAGWVLASLTRPEGAGSWARPGLAGPARLWAGYSDASGSRYLSTFLLAAAAGPRRRGPTWSPPQPGTGNSRADRPGTGESITKLPCKDANSPTPESAVRPEGELSVKPKGSDQGHWCLRAQCDQRKRWKSSIPELDPHYGISDNNRTG